MRIRRATRAEARFAAQWIAKLHPWSALGYSVAGLGRWLARRATAQAVMVAVERDEVVGVVVVDPAVLLGSFISLLAVLPAAQGRGIGKALVERVATQTFRKRRWLYTSSDAGNAAAARLYKRLGFARVGKLPDLVAPGHDELLWRRGASRKAV